MNTRYLRQLEAQSIHILREVAAEFEHPTLLFSGGKDSTVLIHLARKAYFPEPIPFPVLHIDTNWQFQEALDFRDQTVADLHLDLIVHSNREAVDANASPFNQETAAYSNLVETIALRQAIKTHRFDATINGARHDEAIIRSKTSTFTHHPNLDSDQESQKFPELWTLFNGLRDPSDHIAISPIADWSELDVWNYIKAQDIAVAPLYFAKSRPVVRRPGALVMVDDDRFQLQGDETPEMREVRFRSIGCYPLSGATESSAADVEAVITELTSARLSERHGRLADKGLPDTL